MEKATVDLGGHNVNSIAVGHMNIIEDDQIDIVGISMSEIIWWKGSSAGTFLAASSSGPLSGYCSRGKSG